MYYTQVQQFVKGKIDKEIVIFQNKLKQDEIALSSKEFNPKKHKMIIGSINFNEINFNKLEDLGVLEIITGNAFFTGSSVKRSDNLRIVGGSLSFSNGTTYFSGFESLPNLELVGGICDFSFSTIKEIPKLKGVLHNLIFSASEIKELQSLYIVGGNVSFENSKVEDLGKLHIVGASINFSDSKITQLNNLTHIGLDLTPSIPKFYTNGNFLTETEIINHLLLINQEKIIRAGHYYIKDDGKNKTNLLYKNKISDLGISLPPHFINRFPNVFYISYKNGLGFDEYGNISWYNAESISSKIK